jgi:hypothetical protein
MRNDFIGGDFDWSLAWSDFAMGRNPETPVKLNDWDSEFKEYVRRKRSLEKIDWDVSWRVERARRAKPEPRRKTRIKPLPLKPDVSWDDDWVRFRKRIRWENFQRVIDPSRPRRKYPDGREPIRGVERLILDVEEIANAHRHAEDMWWQTVLDFYRVAAAGFAIAICLIALCGGFATRGLVARRFFWARSEFAVAALLSWFALCGDAFSRTAPRRPRNRWWQSLTTCWRKSRESNVLKVLRPHWRAQARKRRHVHEGAGGVDP